MFLRIKRHLMAEADQGGSSGNSAAPATAPAAENVPQAQGAPAVTKEIADYIQSEIAKGMQAERDKIFAEARRTFTEKRNKPKDESPTTAAPAQPDPHEERRVLRDFDRTLTRLGLHEKVSPTQWSRAEKALLAERPDDVTSWVKDYFEGFGVAQAAPAPQQQQQAAPAAAPKPANDHPESNRGGSPSPRAPLVEADLVTMAPADRDALIREKGVRWYHQQLTKQLKDKVVQVRR